VRPALTLPGVVRPSAPKKTDYEPWSVLSSPKDGRTGRLGTMESNNVGYCTREIITSGAVSANLAHRINTFIASSLAFGCHVGCHRCIFDRFLFLNTAVKRNPRSSDLSEWMRARSQIGLALNLPGQLEIHKNRLEKVPAEK